STRFSLGKSTPAIRAIFVLPSTSCRMARSGSCARPMRACSFSHPPPLAAPRHCVSNQAARCASRRLVEASCSPLPLLVPRIFAEDSDDTAPPHHFALRANRLDRRFHFHCPPHSYLKRYVMRPLVRS